MKHHYKDIEYTLTRSRRKTASIYVERDGSITVKVPEQLTDLEVEDMLENKRSWIYRNQAEWEDLNATRTEREYVSGEGFLFLGRSYRLTRVVDQGPPLLLKNGYFCLRADIISDDDSERTFKEFYREKAKQRISERVRFYQNKMGVQPHAIRIIDLKNRWASCSSKQNLNFHWKCMMAPLTVIDYIVVHELAHLIHPRHTDDFWNEVDKILGDYQDRKAWLRKNGAGMSL